MTLPNSHKLSCAFSRTIIFAIDLDETDARLPRDFMRGPSLVESSLVYTANCWVAPRIAALNWSLLPPRETSRLCLTLRHCKLALVPQPTSVVRILRAPFSARARCAAQLPVSFRLRTAVPRRFAWGPPARR